MGVRTESTVSCWGWRENVKRLSVWAIVRQEADQQLEMPAVSTKTCYSNWGSWWWWWWYKHSKSGNGTSRKIGVKWVEGSSKSNFCGGMWRWFRRVAQKCRGRVCTSVPPGTKCRRGRRKVSTKDWRGLKWLLHWYSLATNTEKLASGSKRRVSLAQIPRILEVASEA